MFRNVLVGVDGSASGRDAIALARQLIELPSGKLTLAHVRDGRLRPSHAITPGMLEEEREASADLLEAEREASGVSAELVSIVAYDPGRGLHEQADSQGADLLVVGTCRHGIIGRAMLGDDTRAALNGAPCAVAIAPAGYAEHPVALSKIGVAYNQSPESEQALEAARRLAAATGGQVQALEVVVIPTVLYTGVMPPLVGAGVDTVLEESLARMNTLPGVQGRAVYGVTGEELAEFGDELDLLVVGSRGYGPAKRLVLGSTSNYLERHARCALLVLPRVVAVHLNDAAGHDQAQADEPVGASV